MNLAVTLGRLHLRNPILVASGTFGLWARDGRRARFRQAGRRDFEEYEITRT